MHPQLGAHEISSQDAQMILAVSPRCIYAWLETGVLRGFQGLDRHWTVVLDSIQEIIIAKGQRDGGRCQRRLDAYCAERWPELAAAAAHVA